MKKLGSEMPSKLVKMLLNISTCFQNYNRRTTFIMQTKLYFPLQLKMLSCISFRIIERNDQTRIRIFKISKTS